MIKVPERKLNFLIIGAGLSGCTAARMLADAGHRVSIIEREDHIGGLCTTATSPAGIPYEPFGARTFHTSDSRIKYFVNRFDTFNGYTHRKGMILNGQLFPFPITRTAIDKLKEKEQIREELRNRPATIDTTNFETAAISIFGRTLYDYFIKNYTAKMWGADPKKLTAEWAPKRLELRDDDSDELFKNQWQGLPTHGYSFLLQTMIGGIPVQLLTTQFDPSRYDAVISTAPIDMIMEYAFGKLHYRSLEFEYVGDEPWENDAYGTINLPQHSRYIRKCNFNVLHRQPSTHTFIQYQAPVASDDAHSPMYPVHTPENDRLFERYLRRICQTNIIPAGRLGLFKYLDMDKAVGHIFDMETLLLEYPFSSPDERYKNIRQIIERY